MAQYQGRAGDPEMEKRLKKQIHKYKALLQVRERGREGEREGGRGGERETGKETGRERERKGVRGGEDLLI